MIRKYLLMFGLFAFASTMGFAQAKVHDWTNKGGRTIKARFVKADDSTVTIFLNGRNYVLKFSDLSPESQALAKK